MTKRTTESYIKVNAKKFADLEAGTTVLIPSVDDIEDEVIAAGPDAELTLTELRNRLARRHGADGTCPVMCGMNLRKLDSSLVARVTTLRR